MSEFKIIKRNGTMVNFDVTKINNAITKAFESINKTPNKEELDTICNNISNSVKEASTKGERLSVEQIQDMIENSLMHLEHQDVLKSFILYRNERQKMREIINNFNDIFKDDSIVEEMKLIQKEYTGDGYKLSLLYNRFKSFYKEGLSIYEKLDILVKSALELTSKEAPNWEYISARFLSLKLHLVIKNNTIHLGEKSLYNKIKFYTNEKLYGKYILENYSKEDIDELENYIDDSRDKLLNYSSLNLMIKRYLIVNHKNKVVETPQEMFMGIAMHLAIPEGDNKVVYSKKFYDMLSKLKVTMATPTMANARKDYHQLSSCFIDTVDDSLSGIYKSIDNFAQVSKTGGGMGLYFGKVRANGSDIRGFKGVAGGVIRWIRLANDTAIAVDQLGVRQGSVAVYLDVWHKDIPEFLQLKTNNGDDRAKAHDVFPAICFPDLFWRLAKESLDNSWYLMCPHEIKTVKGYSLEDSYGEEWERKYYECVNDERIDKREIQIKDIVRMFIKSTMETGTPFAFNRDHVNRANPNKHCGMVYSSNLCTEIIQNMSTITDITSETIVVDGESIVVQKSKAGDFVVCNLASLVLGNINVNDEVELEDIIKTVTRALDNVIDLNYYPIEYARITNKNYRAIGLGASGYHHMLANNGIIWESEQHIEFADKLFEKINYYTIKSSMELAKEKGSYLKYSGSDWNNGNYFDIRGYDSEEWLSLKKEVMNNGIRNGYLLAVAPTGSTSIIACTTASTDPIMSKYFLEEKKGDIVPRVAPNLTDETFWTYKNAHHIDQHWTLRATGARQKHIDQSQSLNLYVTLDNSMRDILNLYIHAWEEKIKTVYYIRSKSLEVEECDSCAG